MSSTEIPEDAPSPRLSHLVKWPDFDGYGFNLHAEKSKPGQYIGKVDEGSPAESAGLRSGDRIIEVNGVNIANENHKQVVERIKAVLNETRLLVADDETDKWYKERKLVIKGSQPNVQYIKTPVHRPGSQQQVEVNDTASSHSHDEDIANGVQEIQLNGSEEQPHTENKKKKKSGSISSNTSSTPSASHKDDTNSIHSVEEAKEERKSSLRDDTDSIGRSEIESSVENRPVEMSKKDLNATPSPRHSPKPSFESDPERPKSVASVSSGGSSRPSSVNGTPPATPRPMMNGSNGVGPGGDKLNLNMTAQEMRAMLAARKKHDPKKDAMDLRQKYNIIQSM